jgi:hypothetical protein
MIRIPESGSGAAFGADEAALHPPNNPVPKTSHGEARMAARGASVVPADFSAFAPCASQT